MKKILLFLGGFIALLLVALVIFVSTFDINQYKGQIVSLVEQKTGRQFSVGGDLKLGVSLIPTVEVQDVTLGNAKWGSTKDMVKVKSFAMQLGLIPLLSGNIKISQLTLDTADINLETNKDGVGNWVFSNEKQAPAEQKSGGSESAASININEVNIQNARLTYKDGKTGKTTKVSIDKFKVEGGTFSQKLNIVLKAVYNEVPVNVDGKIGSLASLTDNKEFPVDIKANVGSAVATVEGSVGEPKTLKDADLKISLKTESFAPFEKILEKKLPDIGAIDVSGHIKEKKGVYQLDDVSINALSSKVDVSGQVSAKQPAEVFDANIKLETSTLANFNRIKDMTGREFPDVGPLNLKGHISGKDNFYVLDNVSVNLNKDLLAVNGKLSAKDPAKGFDLEIKFNAENLSKFNALAGRKLPNAGPVLVTGHVSEADGIYLFKNVDAELGKSKLTVDGKLTDLKKTDGSNLNINFQSESLADLNGLAGSNLPALSPVSFNANVSDQKGSYYIKGMKLNAAKTDLTGDMVVNIQGSRPAVSATLTSNLIDLTPFESGKEAQKDTRKDKVFPSDPLPLDKLKAADANLDITAKKVKTTDLEYDNVKLVMALNGGKLSLKPLNANVAGGTFAIDMDMDGSNGKSAKLDTNINVKGFQPSALPKYKDKISGAKTDATINISGSGKSVAAIMAKANGKILVKTGAGKLKSSSANKATSDIFLSAFDAIYPGAGGGSSDTVINCGVVNMTVKDGIATADKGIAVSTQKMNIIGSGIVNLKTEQLDIAIDPQAREGVGISAGQLAELVKIGGTLAEPKAVPSTKAALKTAVSVGAAVATGGLSILAQGLYDRSTADEDPCATALGVKSKTTKKQTTTATKTETKTTTTSENKTTTDKAVDSVKDTGKAITDGIKGLFGD